MESIIADVAHLSDEDLETFRANTAWFWPRHFDEFYLELIRRGDEGQVACIESPAILQEFCDKGNQWAAWELYFKNRYGDEEHGIFIHHKEARIYYDLGQITLLLLQRQTMASLCSTPSAILSRI